MCVRRAAAEVEVMVAVRDVGRGWRSRGLRRGCGGGLAERSPREGRAEPRVRVRATFPAGSHPEIVYPAAKVAASRHPHAAAFVRWLQAPAARAIFRRRGFSLR